MAQLDPARYRKLTIGSTYGSGDGLYHDTTNDQICVVLGDTILTRFDATGMDGDLEFSSEANGDILVRVAGVWTRLAKGSAYQTLAMPSAADVPAWADGVLESSVDLTPTTIVGNSAGDIGHADGVTLVAAVANKVIVPERILISYTYSTAAYGGGGNLTANYKDGGSISEIVSAANSLGAAASNINLMFPTTGVALAGKALTLVSSGAFTNPGTAAGTAVVKTGYRLISA